MLYQAGQIPETIERVQSLAQSQNSRILSIPFDVILKPRGATCNLGCRYCFYLPKEKLYAGSTLRMSDELLEEFTRQYIAAQPASEITFAWQGGEPTLMGLDFYRRTVELQHKYRRPGMPISNASQTNGVLLTDEWCAFFRKHVIDRPILRAHPNIWYNSRHE